MPVSKEDLLDTMGDFTWFWGMDWFIETKDHGNFHWKDPGYNGDDTITPYPGSYDQFRLKLQMPYGRDKGCNLIRNKCGTDFTLAVSA